jgi:hypothetical protein
MENCMSNPPKKAPSTGADRDMAARRESLYPTSSDGG